MLPGRFIDRSKEPDGAMFASEIIQEVSKGAKCRDNNNAEPHNESIIHMVIIAYPGRVWGRRRLRWVSCIEVSFMVEL